MSDAGLGEQMNVIRLKEVPCPLCGSSDNRPYVLAPSHYDDSRWQVVRCNCCDMIYTNPQIETYVDEVENRGVLGRHLNPDVLKHSSLVAHMHTRLLGDLVKGRKIFDYGCGAGSFVATAIKSGWDAIGFDLNHALVAAANAHWGIGALYSGNWDAFQEGLEGIFDAVVANQVFEHIQDPISVGNRLVRLLKPGGVLLIDVPNVQQPREWLDRGRTLDPTAHWSHYSRKTLCQLVEQIECKVIYCNAAPAMLGIWRRFLSPERTAILGIVCKRISPSVGTGVCVVGRK